MDGCRRNFFCEVCQTYTPIETLDLIDQGNAGDGVFFWQSNFKGIAFALRNNRDTHRQRGLLVISATRWSRETSCGLQAMISSA